jgi:hypothetical protein
MRITSVNLRPEPEKSVRNTATEGNISYNYKERKENG